jgi:hypothetical protein
MNNQYVDVTYKCVNVRTQIKMTTIKVLLVTEYGDFKETETTDNDKGITSCVGGFDSITGYLNKEARTCVDRAYVKDDGIIKNMNENYAVIPALDEERLGGFYDCGVGAPCGPVLFVPKQTHDIQDIKDILNKED